MYEIAEIINVLTYDDKYKLIKLWSYQSPLEVRIRLMRDILLVRLNTYVEGWDIMEYNLRFQIMCNRILNELNIIVLLSVVRAMYVHTGVNTYHALHHGKKPNRNYGLYYITDFVFGTLDLKP